MLNNTVGVVIERIENKLDTVSNEVRTSIIDCVRNVYKYRNCAGKNISILRYIHKDDDYLYRVIVADETKEPKYTMWTYNASRDALYTGMYDCSTEYVVNFLKEKYEGLISK